MLHSFRVENFRSFQRFQVCDLARVNLFVGGNNSGKTSLLEAAELLLSDNPLNALFEIPEGRGEISPKGRKADVSHLFHGHSVKVGSTFEVAETGGDRERSFSCQVVPGDLVDPRPRRRAARESMAPGSPEDSPKPLRPAHGLRVQFDHQSEPIVLELTLDREMAIPERYFAIENRAVPPLKTIGAGKGHAPELWGQIALRPEEDKVTEALRIIEPQIDRVSFIDDRCFIKSSGFEYPLPIGSMGDGISHLLSIAMHLATATSGTLIVDEIDAGLHYSVMARMWKMIVETARRLDLQVLATTHSLDCLRALAALYGEKPQLAMDVSVHRVEREGSGTVRYGADEIAAAIEHEMEIR